MRNILLVVLLVGCGQMPGIGGEEPVNIPNVQTMDAGDGPPVVSGTRLRAGFYRSADGMKYPSGFFMDTELNLKCLLDVVDEGGSMVCVPATQPRPLYFSDADCSVQIIQSPDGQTAQVQDHGTHKRWVRVGDAYTGTVVRSLAPGGSCGFSGGNIPDLHYVAEDITNMLVGVSEVFE